VEVLWRCCGGAVEVLWKCCGSAVKVLKIPGSRKGVGFFKNLLCSPSMEWIPGSLQSWGMRRQCGQRWHPTSDFTPFHHYKLAL